MIVTRVYVSICTQIGFKTSVLDLKLFDSKMMMSAFRKLLKWLPIRLRRNSYVPSILYSVLFNPPFLKERFVFLGDTQSEILKFVGI